MSSAIARCIIQTVLLLNEREGIGKSARCQRLSCNPAFAEQANSILSLSPSRGSLIRVIIFRRATRELADPAGTRKHPPFAGGREDRITGLYPGTDSIFQLNIRAAYIWRIGRLFPS